MRTKAEWLLIPVILLPIAMLGAAVWWAHRAHEAERVDYRDHGARLARTWLLPEGPAATVRAQFLDHHDCLLGEIEAAPGRTSFHHPRVNGFVMGSAETAPTSWQFVDALPTGIALSSLQDDSVLARIEHGTAPLVAGDVDMATHELAALLKGVDLERLAKAPLAVSTKLYVISTWRAAKRDARELHEAYAALHALAGVVERIESSGRPLPMGATKVDDAVALSAGERQPLLICLRPEMLTALGTTVHDRNGPMSFTWMPVFDQDPQADTVWSGSVSHPVSGFTSFHLASGSSWWQSPRFRKWVWPSVLIALALTALPLLLLVSLRRGRRLDEQRTRFINEIAHDLRTPLTSVRLYADLLDKSAHDPPTRKRHVTTLRRESSRLTALLGNLLDLSRLDGEHTPPARSKLRVLDVVSRAVADFRLVYPHRAGDVSIGGPDDAIVIADDAVLSRVLANLLDNAGKYTPEDTNIDVVWRESKETVTIGVADQGPGIPLEDRERIFRRYERRKEHVQSGVRGTGLGLALVEELVATMNGQVRLQRSERGARFEVVLPAGGGGTG